jgi:hypothetical protein
MDKKVIGKFVASAINNWHTGDSFEVLTKIQGIDESNGVNSDGFQYSVLHMYWDWVSYEDEQSPLTTRKDNKNRMELVETGFPNALMALGEVMTWAANNKGYLQDDWKDIPNPFNAFLGAASRHRNKRLAGEAFDDESGLFHLSHEAFNVLAQLELKVLGKLDD